MTDQTRWGIDLVQQKNKDKKYQSEQKLKARVDTLEKAMEDINTILKEAYEKSNTKS